MNNRFFIFGIVIVTISVFIYLFPSNFLFQNNNKLLVIKGDDILKESPINPPEMKEPKDASCVFSLWQNNSRDCTNYEELLANRVNKKNFYTIAYGNFLNENNAELHVKKLKSVEAIRSINLAIEKIENTRTIKVKRGDSLYKLAKHYSVSVKDIISRNRIKDPQKIRINQKLLIPLEDKYRIISINVEGYNKARKICDDLTKREFICGISSQKK